MELWIANGILKGLDSMRGENFAACICGTSFVDVDAASVLSGTCFEHLPIPLLPSFSLNELTLSTGLNMDTYLCEPIFRACVDDLGGHPRGVQKFFENIKVPFFSCGTFQRFPFPDPSLLSQKAEQAGIVSNKDILEHARFQTEMWFESQYQVRFPEEVYANVVCGKEISLVEKCWKQYFESGLIFTRDEPSGDKELTRVCVPWCYCFPFKDEFSTLFGYG